MKNVSNTNNINDTAKKLTRKVILERALWILGFVADLALMLAFVNAGISGEDVAGVIIALGIIAACIMYLIVTTADRAIRNYMLNHYGHYVDRNGNTYTKK